MNQISESTCQLPSSSTTGKGQLPALNRKQRRNQKKQEKKRSKQAKDQFHSSQGSSFSIPDQSQATEKQIQPFELYKKRQISDYISLQFNDRVNDPFARFKIPHNTTGAEEILEYLPMETLANLRKIHLDQISIEIDMEYFFSNFLLCGTGPKPAEFLVTKSVLSFESIDQLKNLRKTLNEYVKTVPKFRLKLENFICRVISRYDSHTALVLTMALLSNNPIEEIISVADYCEIEDARIEMLHLAGRLQQISLAGYLFGDSCKNNLRLSAIWNWKNATFIDWSDLILQCNQSCIECSSLFLLIGLRKSVHRSFSVMNVTFGREKFFPSKLLRLSRTIEILEGPETSIKRPALIKIKELELYFGENVSFTKNPDVISRSFKQLESFDILFEKVAFHVEVNSDGWGFLRINLTTLPIGVKFTNGVSVEWDSNSTEKPRLVAIETHSIPQDVIDEICVFKKQPKCLLSPLLYIDQEFDVQFLRPVKVQLPFSGTESMSEKHCEKFKLKVYSKHGIDNPKWTIIQDNSVKRYPNYFIYHSTTFSPVMSVSSEDENSMKAEDFVANHMPIYLTVHALPKRQKVNFDCRRMLNETERLQVVNNKDIEFAAITDMKTADIVHGEIGGNLEIDEEYGYKLGEDKRLVFKYPNPVHIGNDQTYIMRQKDPSRYPEATITYFMSRSPEEEEKLCHLSVEILTRETTQLAGMAAGTENILDKDTLQTILETCKLHWPKLLEHFSIPSSKIAEIQDANVGDVLLKLRSKFAFLLDFEVFRKNLPAEKGIAEKFRFGNREHSEKSKRSFNNNILSNYPPTGFLEKHNR